jgi:hypothetical protein
MTRPFWAAAVSCSEGSSSDGIHLLWTAPPAAGYSVRGYDIQRRVSQRKPKITCHTLDEAELGRLHDEYRLETPLAEFAVSRAACPTPTGPVPDLPNYPDRSGPSRQCVDFTSRRFERSRRGVFGPVSVHSNRVGASKHTLRSIGPFRGLDCGHGIEIVLPAPAARIEATLVQFSRAAKVTALDANGGAIGDTTTTAGLGQPETLTIGAPGIARVVIDAQANDALLLTLCFETEAKGGPRCFGFEAFPAGLHSNPLKTKLGTFAVVDADGVPLPNTAVIRHATFSGLACGQTVQIRLVRPAPAVRVTVVSFAAEVRIDAFEDGGATAGTQIVSVLGRPQSVWVAGRAVRSLRISAPRGEAVLLSLCVGTRRDAADLRRVSALIRDPVGPMPTLVGDGGGAVPSATFAVAPSIGKRCIKYRLRFDDRHDHVRVTASIPSMLAIALREGKAVDSRWTEVAGGIQNVTFERRGVDEVLLYTARAVTSLTVCLDVLRGPEAEERDWASAPFVVQGVQLPLRRLDASLATAADEVALARSRLAPGEAIAAAHFLELSRTMNAAVVASRAAPVVQSTLVREQVGDPFLEVRPWPLGLSALVVPAWRRALGFGWLDGAANLVAGEIYDYRITGHFRRRDLYEELLAFHTVPAGTTLPPSFHIGPVHISLPSPRAIEHFPAPVQSAVRSTGRKGLPLIPEVHGGRSITISFNEPIARVVLEFEPTLGGTLEFEAESTDFILGIAGASFTGTIAPAERVPLDFSTPIDTLVLRGEGLLYGLRLTDPTAGDPDDVIPVSVVVPNVRFEPTSRPAPPTTLGTTNLQEPILPGDPAVTTQRPPQALGFRLHWLPPPDVGSSGSAPWPSDLGAYPPFDVLGFRIERRRSDTGGTFAEISGGTSPMTLFGNRRGRRTPRQLSWGVDILELFHDGAGGGAVDPFMTTDDILRGQEAPGGPPPGSLFQYRIYSIDAIGRLSTTATPGSVVRLEKHLAPPSPPGPPAAVPARPEPAGVRARVLQATDPELAPDDIALLGTSNNAIVLDWGWTDEERVTDPFATEFRVYLQPIPPDIVNGRLNGPATLVGGLWQMTATLDQPIEADAMRGRYFRAPAYPFKVASHTGGQSITVRLEPAALQAATAPTTADFVFRPVLDGTELRPARWAERAAVIPIHSTMPAPYVFRDRLTIDANHPRVRVWVGVSSADAESYVPDELTNAALNGGRPGNESSIAAAVAEARFIGRPTFVPPPPLAVIPELVTPEPTAETVSVALDLPALLPTVAVPAGHAVVLDQISVAALISAVSRTGDGRVGVVLPGNTTSSYSLANAADQTALLDQIATGEPARVEGRFVADLLRRFAAGFERWWERAIPGPVAFGDLSTQLPSKANRYLYRIRLADPAGHVSSQSAMIPRLVRVPSTRRPSPPRMEMTKSTTDIVSLSARVVEAFDIRWLLIFAIGDDLATAPDVRTLERATLLRLPNRRDLYPNDGIRLRLADGTLLSPTVIDLQVSAVSDLPHLLVGTTVPMDYDERVSVWAVAVTRDGFPSRIAGPTTTTTGPRPLVVPALVVTTSGGIDSASWAVPVVPAEISLERTTDGGTTWRRVSPWLPQTAAAFELPGSGQRLYRLMLRGRRDQVAAGSAVAPV